MTDLETTLREALDAAANAVPLSPHPLTDYRQQHLRRSRRPRFAIGLSVGAVAGVIALIVVAAVVLGRGGNGHDDTIANGRTVSLTPTTSVSQAGLAASARILQERLRALGVTSATVSAHRGGLSARVPVSAVPTLRTTAATAGVLQFRQVLGWTETVASTRDHPPKHPVTDAATASPALLRTLAKWNCLKDPAPTHGTAATDYIVACASSPDGLNYLLAPSSIDGSEISGVSDGIDQTGQWDVNLMFDGKGSTAWDQLTAKTYEVDHGTPDVGSATSSPPCGPPKGCNAVSITLDGTVVSAPYSETDGIPGGNTQISGSFTHQQADRLADVLKYGALPTTFRVSD